MGFLPDHRESTRNKNQIMPDAYPLRKTSISRVEIESFSLPDGNPGCIFFVVVWWSWGAAKERPEYFWNDDLGNRLADRAAAEKFAKRFKVGSIATTEIYDTETARGIVDAGHYGIPEFEEEHLLPAYQILFDFNISSEIALATSRNTIKTISIDRAKKLKEVHGELWPAAANYEYCLQTFDPSHPAFIASECLFHFYITDEQYWVGYKLRDLELVLAGIEESASANIERSRKAGAKGRESSSRRKMQRVIDLLGRMESIVHANPIAKQMEPEELARHALRDVDKAIWSQGRGQVADYLGEVRRGELGEDLQNRYRALFPDKPPKRFP